MARNVTPPATWNWPRHCKAITKRWLDHPTRPAQRLQVACRHPLHVAKLHPVPGAISPSLQRMVCGSDGLRGDRLW